MRVIFAGTPEFAATALQAIHAAGHAIPLVLTQPDRPAGRGMQLQPSPVKQCALGHALPVLQPRSLRLDGRYPDDAQAAHEALRRTEHDVMIVAAYGLLLPQSVLDIPRLGCINIHASLLPRWRGAAPIHRAIEAGDCETGVTLMQMDAGLDTGAMLAVQRCPIEADATTGHLHDTLAALGARMTVELLARLEHGTLAATPQPEHGVTYAAKISKEEARLAFAMHSAAQLARKVRAFSPFPGCHTVLDGQMLKIWRAEALPASAAAQPGTLVAVDAQLGLDIACTEGILRVHELQRPGGKRLAVAAFLQGCPLHTGQMFDA